MRALVCVVVASFVRCSGEAPVVSEPSDPTGDLGTPPPDVDTDAPPTGETDAVGADSDTDVGDSDTDVPIEAACRLGWGETELHLLTDGDAVPVIRGLQGRWHVPGAVTCQGIDPGRSFDELGREFGDEGVEPAVFWRVETPDGAFLGGYPPDGSTTPLYRPMKTDAGPALLNERLVLWTGTYEEAVDRDAVMTFSLTDAAGVHVEARVAIHLVDPTPPVDTDTDTVDTDPADTDTDAAVP